LRRVKAPGWLRLAAAAGIVVAVLGVVIATDPAERVDQFTDPPSFTERSGEEDLGRRDFVARHLASSSGSGRYQFWEAAWKAFESKPIAGLGAGEYEAWWAEHGSLPYYIRNAHSLYMEALGELGLVGFLLIAAFVVTLLVAGTQRRRQGSSRWPGVALAGVAAGALSAGIEWTWELPAAFLPFVVLAAVVTGPALRPRAEVDEGPSRYGWGVLVVLAGWVALIMSANSLLTATRLDDSREAAAADDLGEALNDANAARVLQPWSSAPRRQLALVYEADGRFDRAREEIDEAIERGSRDWRLHLLSARIRVEMGDVRGAEREIRRARELNPRSPLLQRGRP
jgi:hypothetical protein